MSRGANAIAPNNADGSGVTTRSMLVVAGLFTNAYPNPPGAEPMLKLVVAPVNELV